MRSVSMHGTTKVLFLESLGDYTDSALIAAIQCYNKALKIDEKVVKAWNSKGVTLEKIGKYEEAEECYERAKKLS